MARGGKSLFSLTTVFASFFGAALIAGAFAYFNYKFSEYKFIDFSQFSFFTDKTLFQAKEEKYAVIFFSSKEPQSIEKIKKLHLNYPILAIDYYNKKIKSEKNILFLRSGTNTSLKFIQRFNIYNEPVIFFIKKVNKHLYKQDSMIRTIDNFDQLPKE